MEEVEALEVALEQEEQEEQEEVECDMSVLA